MSDTSSSVFEPVSTDEAHVDASREIENPDPPAREASSEEYPLAGPILDGARSRVLRGQCSECGSRLRIRIEEEIDTAVRVRCPICSHARRIEL